VRPSLPSRLHPDERSDNTTISSALITPAAVVLLTLIGAIIAVRKIRGGSGVHLAIGIMICAVFILADRFSTIFSTKGSLHPVVAAWLPIAIFGALTWWLYEKAPK
jgi:lipopolysaccharide export system permease protein